MEHVTYVALAVKGIALDAQSPGARADEATALHLAEQEVKRLNSQVTGESLGYSALVVPVPAR